MPFDNSLTSQELQVPGRILTSFVTFSKDDHKFGQVPPTEPKLCAVLNSKKYFA